MENEQSPIPLCVALLLVGYFHHTITETEQEELDTWINESVENQQVFENCLEMTLQPYIPNELDKEKEELIKEQEEMDNYLPHIADLIMKHMKNNIRPKEEQELKDWRELSPANEELFNSIPKTSNMEEIFKWIYSRFWQSSSEPRLN